MTEIVAAVGVAASFTQLLSNAVGVAKGILMTLIAYVRYRLNYINQQILPNCIKPFVMPIVRRIDKLIESTV